MNSHWRNGIIGAVAAAFAGLLVWWTPAGVGLINLSYDLPFLFRNDIKAEGVTLLYMDLDSDTRLEQTRNAIWDRRIHAKLLDRLREMHARAVVFDVLFVPSKSDPEGDRLLVEAASAFGKVVTVAKPNEEFHEGEFMGKPVTGPFPALADVTRWGIVEAPDSQKIFRRHFCRDSYAVNAPCLASVVAEVAQTNFPPEKIVPRWLNFYGPPRAIRHFSYYKAFLTNQIPLDAISNQVVFVGGLYDVGFTGGKRADDYPTPYTRQQGLRAAGVEIEATAYLNMVHNSWLLRPSLPIEALLLAITGALLGLGAARLRPLPVVGAGLLAALVIAIACSWSVWHTHVWLPWMIPVAVQVPVAICWSILAHTGKLAREKQTLEQALALASGGEASLDEPLGRRNPAGSSPRSASEFGHAETIRNQPARAAIPDHELLRCIGKGAYGEVWLARDAIGTFHAVKIVHRDAFRDSVPLEREFNGIRKFTPISRSHPGFVNILHVGRNEAQGYIFYVMEIGDDEVSGQKIDPKTYKPLTLARLIEKQGRLPLPECLSFCIQLADALAYLHSQELIHRDIKPSNIIFVKNVPKFADIGLVTDVATHGRDVTYLGTPGRIAPEGPGSPTSDIYSLGKIIYEAGLGLDITRFPELPTALIQSADEAGLFQLNRIILKACETDLRRRYATAAALRDDLIELQKQLQPSKAPGNEVR